MRTKMNSGRRAFLEVVANGIIGASMGPSALAARLPAGFAPDFAAGIASGSPSPDGFVIWTRLFGSELQDLDAVPVHWEVLADGDKPQPVAKGVAIASKELAHSVHVEVQGLRPDRWYRYQFRVGDVTSPVGRSRTSPLPDVVPGKWRLGYASCQRWEDGYYGAYRHMAEESLDLVVFLGDYIYEYQSRKSGDAVRTHPLPHIRTLDDYRRRYALYRSDPELQRMHAACPWMVVWDDHETENDYAGSLSLEGTADFAPKRAAAYQAFYEHMPLRASALVRGLAGLHDTGSLRIYDQVDFGRLARLQMLDTRQYREAPGCGNAPSAKVAAVCQPDGEGERSMLGLEQMAWLERSLKESARRGISWNVLAQQTGFTARNYRHGHGKAYSSDGWDGYPDARGSLIDALAASKASNPVFLGGDIHQNWVANVHRDPYDVSTPVIASEFCGTSISSRGRPKDRTARVAATNPHCVLADSEHRGYGVLELTRKRTTVALRVVDDVASRATGIRTLAEFAVESGNARIRKL
ncbi:alkaline phosphatase D family protein [Aquabacterium sp. A7-Y]|uniref:alkaline phosphatase D family protein n=1 Tax=Aquabacterium sp. A7-Y TaxID=1349605 RepID=UPI00223E75AE|nr:alkaline phosphatase D family protein [Aquabacterium sp. A7-Y]MCW7538931.1 alkaline phosphatase D family protein [Aquabacterium sp. A7-Y]